jgi:predicted ATP-grasp superfamily ATP-dependent carboligase
MNNFILIEYFTSQSNIKSEYNKEIFREALNLSNCIIRNFTKDKNIDTIHVIRNENLEKRKSKKVKYYFTNQYRSYLEVLKNFTKNTKVILISPETKKLSIELFSNIKKDFNVLSSDFKCIKIFASKIDTFKHLKKYELPTVEPYKKKIRGCNYFVCKPEYDAGSSKTFLIKNPNDLDVDEPYFCQKYYTGIKGSFLMLCKNGEFKVMCCNRQIIKIKDGKISQIGILMGGLEEYRKKIELLAKKICKRFTGLFGIVGVDIVKYKKNWLILEINTRFTSSYVGLKHSYTSDTIDEITYFYVNNKIKEKSNSRFIKKYKYIF